MKTTLAIETLKQFRIIIAAMRQHFQELEAACGISGAQVWMLAAISENPEITVTKLSNMLAVRMSGASNMLDKLAKADLIDRSRSEDDRRVINLVLTVKGQEVLNRAPKPLIGLMPFALEKLPEQTLLQLHNDLSSLIRQMNAFVDPEAANLPLSQLVRFKDHS